MGTTLSHTTSKGWWIGAKGGISPFPLPLYDTLLYKRGYLYKQSTLKGVPHLLIAYKQVWVSHSCHIVHASVSQLVRTC